MLNAGEASEEQLFTDENDPRTIDVCCANHVALNLTHGNTWEEPPKTRRKNIFSQNSFRDIRMDLKAQKFTNSGKIKMCLDGPCLKQNERGRS